MSVEIVMNRIMDTERLFQRNAFGFMEDTVNVAYGVAQKKVPVWTGFLRGSITATVRRIGRNLIEAVLAAYAHYAVYQEFGTGRYAENGRGRKTPWTYFIPGFGWVTTVGNKPNPYMRPGYEAARDWVLANGDRFSWTR